MSNASSSIEHGSGEHALNDAKAALLSSYFKLPLDESQTIAEELATVRLEGGEALFHQNDATDSMYLLVRGRLQVWIDTTPPVFIGEVLPGESVGEVGVITGEKRSADVLASRNSVLIKLYKADFERLAAKHPAMVMQLTSIVAKRLHDNTTGANKKSRPAPSIICIRSLDNSDSLARLASEVTQSLDKHGTVLSLTERDAETSAIPFSSPEAPAEPSESFQHWFSQQETAFRFIVLVCDASQSPWADFAERQSDLILLLADSNSNPSPRPFETENPGDQKRIKHKVLVLQHLSDKITGTHQWLQPRTVDYHLHLRGDSKQDLARLGRIVSGNANGLVLGGGAARGFAHVGIYRALHEADIPIDWFGGTSIGAIMGVAMALFEEPDLIESKVREAFVNGKPFGDFTLPLVSILAGNRMNTLTQEFMPGEIENLAVPFFAISSDISSGNVNIHESGPIWRATGASAALPGVLPPVIYNNSLAMDGAILNNLPVDVMATKPVGKIYASMLTSKDQNAINFDDMPSSWQIMLDRLMPASSKKQIPGLATLLFKATEVANRKRTNDLAAAADVLFTPPVQEFSLLSVDHFDQVVEVGYSHARSVIAG